MKIHKESEVSGVRLQLQFNPALPSTEPSTMLKRIENAFRVRFMSLAFGLSRDALRRLPQIPPTVREYVRAANVNQWLHSTTVDKLNIL
eukprot:6118829-Amphidinium_carterae.1